MTDVRITSWKDTYGFVIWPGCDEHAFIHTSTLPEGYAPRIGHRLRVDVVDSPKGPRVSRVLAVLDDVDAWGNR